LVTLRCTVKTLKRFRLDVDEDPAVQSRGVLGDWYVNLMSLGRQRLVLCTAERSLLPVVMPALNSEFPGRLPEYVWQMLLAVGIPEGEAKKEAEQLNELQVGRTQSRSILGVMNDYQHMTRHYPSGGSILDLGVWLAGTPFQPLKDFPDRVTRSLFCIEEARRQDEALLLELGQELRPEYRRVDR
jgi:hypothetical protein